MVYLCKSCAGISKIFLSMAPLSNPLKTAMSRPVKIALRVSPIGPTEYPDVSPSTRSGWIVPNPEVIQKSRFFTAPTTRMRPRAQTRFPQVSKARSPLHEPRPVRGDPGPGAPRLSRIEEEKSNRSRSTPPSLRSGSFRTTTVDGAPDDLVSVVDHPVVTTKKSGSFDSAALRSGCQILRM
jgi:hypothetical protein